MCGNKGWINSSLTESNIRNPGTISLRWWATQELTNAREECPGMGQSMACVTYHVSTDGLGHHAPNGSFGASSCWHGWGGWWDEDRWDGGLWRRRSWSWRRGDMNRSWHRWRHGRRRFGPRCRSGRFGLWSWHHFADDSVGATLRIVRADGRESNDQSPIREKENTEQLTHVTLESPKRLF